MCVGAAGALRAAYGRTCLPGSCLWFYLAACLPRPAACLPVPTYSIMYLCGGRIIMYMRNCMVICIYVFLYSIFLYHLFLFYLVPSNV